MRIAETVTFAGGGLDRAAHLRGDAGALARARAEAGACILPLWKGKPLVVTGAGSAPCLCLVAEGDPLLTHAHDAPLFLGLDGKAPRFAADLPAWMPPEDVDLPEPGRFFDPTRQPVPGREPAAFCELRGVMAALSPVEASLAATARSLLSWHRAHGYCSACGAATDMAQSGWQRSCPTCHAQHFPRTDPVVIMLVTHGNSVLLGRSPGWPAGMYSLLAGFLEPGETIEDAVRRETLEEAGVKVGRVDYLASQPWPYPSSLMVGCAAQALSREIVLDPKELDDALWLDRESALDVLSGRHVTINAPRAGAIAGFLLRNWLADRLD